MTAAPATPHRRIHGRRPAATASILATAAVAVLALGSCSAPSTDAGRGTSSSATADQAAESLPPDQGTAVPAPPASTADPAAPGTDIARVAASVEAAVRALAGGQESVTSDQVRGAVAQGFTDAAAVPESLEVSIDRTPTGLDVDAIQGAGLLQGSCVFVEVREGTVSASVLPVLASGRCFVGDQR
ncbi:DUF6993 domain-containing protein [Arthrobacter ruber]|uniref:DUF6993 domain-containing protein n=1 Tax=Arthrobacter ruber TaxID=1258893 RepID=UPI000CF4A7E0|nr:hypothetical protein [Arthrobacter ruber]